MSDINLKQLAQDVGVESLEVVPRDASPRHYFRGAKDGRDFVVMLYPHAGEKERAELSEFIRIGQWLRGAGVKAPQLYQRSDYPCFAVFEDLGRVSFGKALREGVLDQEQVYTKAIDVLIQVSEQKEALSLPDYQHSVFQAKRRQFIDYYVALKRGEKSSEKLVSDYFDVWTKIEKDLPSCPYGFIHADFHLENLIYCPEESGVHQAALIDYQDAVHGPICYDVVNILEDARADVPVALRQKMLDRYLMGFDEEERAAFLAWYRVLGTQFHGRVLGLFIKLSADQGRDDYLIHLNRLQNYMKEALENPILAPLKAWFDKEGLDFEPLKDLHGDNIRNLFSRLNV